MISCFAEPPLESSLFSEARATIYGEEDTKVGTTLLLSHPGWCRDGGSTAALGQKG